MENRERDIYVKLVEEVQELGVCIHDYNDLMEYPIKDKQKDLIDTLLKYISTFEEYNNKGYIVRCLTKKGLFSVTERLLEEFYKYENETYCWIIGNALYTIRDPRYIKDYINIARDNAYESSRQMIILLLGFFNTEEVKQVLLFLLNDFYVCNHALDSLAKFKDPSLYNIIQQYISEESREKFVLDFSAWKIQNSSNRTLKFLNPKDMWSLRIKTAKKFKPYYR